MLLLFVVLRERREEKRREEKRREEKRREERRRREKREGRKVNEPNNFQRQKIVF